MENQVIEIIKKIRSEGVEQAKSEASEIISKAKQEARGIVESAKKESAKMLSDAQEECDHLLETGKDTLQQVARDLCISVELEIKNYFARLLEVHNTEALSGKALTRLIELLIKEWSSAGMTVEVSEKDYAEAGKEIQEMLLLEAQKKGLRIQPVKGQAGFVVKFDKEASYVDFSPETVARMLANRLQPWLAALLHNNKS